MLCNKQFRGLKFFLDSFPVKALICVCVCFRIQLVTELHMSNYYLNTSYIKTLTP